MMANQFESGNEDEDEEDLNVGNANPVHQEFNEEPPKEEHQPEGAEANQYQVYFYDSKEMVKTFF